MASSSSQAPTIQEYSIRVPKNSNKKYSVMSFNSSLNMDIGKWSQVKMVRENNLLEFRGGVEEQPKFGEGSEFGREQREEARRKKYGYQTKTYRPEDQPWLMRVGGKTGKKYRGIREGGISENASYYVFTQAKDGAFEAFPISEWYKFQPINRYKSLSAEEAEEEFARRNKINNLFSIMVRKKLKNEEDSATVDEGDEPKSKSKGKKAKKEESDFKISEMDDWGSSSDDSRSGDEAKAKDSDDDSDGDKKEVKSKKKKAKEEAFEESDDGDEEGREVDYITDSSEDLSDLENQAKDDDKGVDMDDGLRNLLSSGESEEEEEKQDDEDEEEEEEEEKEDEEKKEQEEQNKKKKKKKKKSKEKQNKEQHSDSSGEEKAKKKSKGTESGSSTSTSRAATPTNTDSGELKRKVESDSPDGTANKKQRVDPSISAATPGFLSSSDGGITEEAVRRYLTRKPMTTTELLTKFKSKKTGHSAEQLVHMISQIVKKINPTKQKIKGKLYLSIKS